MNSNQYGPKTKAADQLHAMKYRGIGEDFREAMNRVAFGLKDSDDHYHAFRDILLNQRFMPAGRIQSAIGASRKTTGYNCFVSGTIDDSFVDGPGSIMGRAHQAAATMRMGGGIGYDFSTLRPRGFKVAKIDSQSSGPVSFMPIFDAVCLATASYGHRRGAQMGVLRVDHPDIEEFLTAKQNNTALKGFNISIAVTDIFMHAALNNKEFDLMWDGKPYKTIEAAPLWEKIMRGTWDWAEPGVLFIDTINKMNNLWYAETLAATNPCFAAGTLIVTDKGAFPIEDLIGKKIKIHDGNTWRKIDNFRVTGRYQKMIKITMQDGSELRVTKKHKLILKDGSRKEAGKITISDELMLSDKIYDGNLFEKAAYLKGFLVGDGMPKNDRALLWLYEPKYECKERLIASCSEIEAGQLNTSALADIGFAPVREGCETMTGLAPRKNELHEWVTTARQELPIRVHQWNRKTKLEFIAGIFDADGTAMDTSNAYGYQITSINKKLLMGLQIIMKSIGVRSKLDMRMGTRKNMPGGIYDCQDCWRLSVSQTNSIELSKQVKFSRLKSFANKEIIYKIKSRASRIAAVVKDGVDEVVYCCTVPKTHSLALGIGILSGQCGEQPLPPYGACLLGSFNLTKYLFNIAGDYEFDFQALRNDIPHVVRAMDNVVDRTNYPLAEQRAEAITKRRMGLGVAGLANAGEALGFAYGSLTFLVFEAQVLETIRDESYLASAFLAKEKGSFPLFDHRYTQGEFFKTLPDNVQGVIEEFGIRNSHLTSIAPTGTISMTADNISSGIEPVFSYKITRSINTPEGSVMTEIEDYGVGFLGTKGKVSSEVTAQEHVAVLTTAQRYVDSAVSKTCNVDGNMPWADFKKIYEDAWHAGAKGCTTFNADGKRFALLTPTEDLKASPAELSCEIGTDGQRSCE